jgi:hypothetical protein
VADRLAKVIDLFTASSLIEAERHSETIPCPGPEPVWTRAYLSEDGEDRIYIQHGDAEPVELTEGQAIVIGHHLVSLATIKRAARGLAT